MHSARGTWARRVRQVGRVRVLVRRRGRNRAGARGFPRPYQQYRARGVVDDEPAGRAEALRAEPGVVAVPGQHEQVGALGRRDDLALHAPTPFHGGARAAQGPRRGPEQFCGRRGAELGQPRAGIAIPPWPAAEQAGVGAVRRGRNVSAGDVQQHDVRIVRRELAGRVDAGGPRALDDPGDHGHRHPPITFRPAHSATVARTRPAGTVSRPSLVNSARSGSSWPCSRSTRRHSRVASEPAYVRFGPILVPISTARTAPGPVAAASGSSTSTAGRLLITLASAAARAAVASRAGSVVPLGITRIRAPASRFSVTPVTTMPSASTKARNGTPAARQTAAGVVCRRTSARIPSTAAPAAAAQAGLIPASEVTANPARVAASTMRANTGRPAVPAA